MSSCKHIANAAGATAACALFVTAAPALGDEAGMQQRQDTTESVLAEVLVIGRGYDAHAGAKSLVPLLETPSTLSVIEAERFQEQHLINLEDLLRQTAGVTTTKTISSYPEFYARGFAISSFLTDGVPGISGVAAPYSVPDLFLYERIELLKGPSALFSGSGSPGGSINFARKRPTRQFQFNSALIAGSWNNYRGEADLSGPLAGDGAISGRIGAVYQDAEKHIDNYNDDRGLVFGSLAFDLTDDTTLTIGAHYDQYESTIQAGLPGIDGVGLAKLPRSTYLGGENNAFETRTRQAYAELAHVINDRWNARATVQYTGLKREEQYLFTANAITPTDGTMDLFGYHGKHDAWLLSADTSVVGEIGLFGKTHGVLLGFDYQKSKWDYASNFVADLGGLTLDAYDPRPIPEPPMPIAPGEPGYDIGTEIKRQYGIYGQARITVTDALTAVVGARVSWVSFDFEGFDDVTGLYDVTGKVTPYFGLIYEIAEGWKLYTSYADVFLPQSERNFDDEPVGPVIGKQVEVGVKTNVLDDRLLLSGAIYRIRQSNRAVPDPNPLHVDAYIGAGVVESEGLELEATGTLRSNWSISGGYAYNRNEVVSDPDPALRGEQFITVVPKHSVKLFTNYDFDALNGLSIGGGITWNGETEGAGVRQGSYTVASLRAGYDVTEHLNIALNVDNIFDERYFSDLRNQVRGNYWGTPRSVFVSARFRY